MITKRFKMKKRRKKLNVANVYFAKMNEKAIIPSKRNEDVAFDIYPCFDEDYVLIKPHQTVKIPTGIASVCEKSYGFKIEERSSVGSKGIAVRCGIIDSGYRGQWYVVLTNTTDEDFYIVKSTDALPADRNGIQYCYGRAIAQARLIRVPRVKVIEITKEELSNFDSERGDGGFGSTGK